jgi:hypothetical protein
VRNQIPVHHVSYLEMASSKTSIRIATEADLPAIISLLLTSFRQFSLFSFLHSPLCTNKDAAFDTIWVWRRRLLLGLLDPTVSIIVAELDEGVASTLTKHEVVDDCREVRGYSIAEESWRMLNWVETIGSLSQRSAVQNGKIILGFAIWRLRSGVTAARSTVFQKRGSVMANFRSNHAPAVNSGCCIGGLAADCLNSNLDQDRDVVLG